MDRINPRHRTLAVRVIVVSLALGTLAEQSFNGPHLGLGAPLLILAALVTGWWLRRQDRALDPFDAWLPVGALVFAAFVAVRADPFLVAIDVVAATALTGASLVAMSGLAVTRRSASAVAAMAAWGLGAAMLGAAGVLRTVLPNPGEWPRSVPGWMPPLARGLVLGLPLATVFGVLFASADPIFRDRVADVVGLRVDLGELPGRLAFVVAAAWLLGGSLSLAVTGMPEVERASLGAAAQAPAVRLARSLGPTEALVVLVLVDLVIAGFVALQGAYLFGGVDTLQAAGLTYADYARRGFFELVGAACVGASLVVIVEAAIQRRTRFYVAALVGLIVLTGAVLASAALRLDLYQAAYGWTELRLYVRAAIVTMAFGLAIMLGLVLAQQSRWLSHALAALGLVSLIGLNLLAPAAFVASRNLERVIDPALVPPDGHSGLDAAYLALLPDDAIPVLVDALPRLAPDEALAVHKILTTWRLRQFKSSQAERWPFTWNLGRERARAAMAESP